MAQEDNFFEKARRVLLRAMGVGANKGLAGGRDSISDGNHPVPVSAAEIEAKQKIKVRFARVRWYVSPGDRVCEHVVCGQVYRRRVISRECMECPFHFA